MPPIPENISIIVTRINGEDTWQTRVNATQKCDRLYAIGMLTEAIGMLQNKNYATIGGSEELDAADATEEA